MKIGSTDIVDCKIGTTQVNKIYLGSNLVWEKAGGILLLDLYPNASAAYSLRKLRTAYSGSAIRVRRSSDNSEQDIGFVDNELDTSSLLSFVGAGDGFVSAWYDQSGSSNATQDTAASQPKIVNAGALILENGKPTILWDGTNDYLDSSMTIGSNFTSITIAKTSNQLNNAKLILDETNMKGFLFVNANTFNWYDGASTYNIGSANALQNLFYISANGVDSKVIVNGIDKSINTIQNNGYGSLRIGGRVNVPQYWNGNSQEIIFYPTDQRVNYTGIESNINSHYNIYWDGSQIGLLDDYPNASAAYSLRALNSAYTGAAIKVRRSSDNAEQDIRLLYDGSLDTSSLLSFVGAGNGFVSTWYDQSGNGNNATQSNASSQPKIVDSGSLILVNSKPSILLDGVSDCLATTSLSLSQPISYYHLHKVNTIASNKYYFDSTESLAAQRNVNYYSNLNVLSMFAGSAIYNGGIDTNQHLFAVNFNGATSSLYKDSAITIAESNVGTGSLEGLTLGAHNSQASNFMHLNYQEVIIYNNSFTNRAEIESNINSHYSIY